MLEPDTYSYPRYLRAKTSVDERALNRRVWSAFLDRLVESAPPIRILEVGAGVGATVKRIVRALERRPVSELRYTCVDVTPENVDAARTSLRAWARDRGYAVCGTKRQQWTGGSLAVTIRFVTGDLFAVVPSLDDSFDAVVGQAIFDLLPIRKALGTLRPVLRPGGVWYLPIHFDGVTGFEPILDRALDSKIERLYHESMAGAGQKGGRGGAVTGRRLLTGLRSGTDPLLEVGSSDWIVFPRGEDYPGDEAYFLHHILHFVEEELTEHPELDAETFAAWMKERRQQIHDGELIYVAHQLDVLARRSRADGPSTDH